jgi:protein-glutamine gamma-glutamyltransferase
MKRSTASRAAAQGTAQPSRSGRRLALAGLMLAAILNAHHTAWWCLPVLAAACAWHLRATLHPARWPPRLLRIAIALLLTVGVLLSFRTLNGLDAGATLLTAMTAAKLFESRALRDWYVILGAALFLLLAACLDRQQLWRLPVYASTLWLCAAALRGLDGGANQAPALLLRGAGRQLLLALPLGLVLFVFFPRLPGAFWALPTGDEAITGLSDEMSPGDIARLVESDEPALRARFTGPVPPLQQRYWRGPVLHDFDGHTWRRRLGALARTAALNYQGPAYRYTMTLEPNTHGTVLALELAMPSDLPFLRFSYDYQLLTPRPISQAQSFDLVSYPQATSSAELSALARRVDLALPADRNPRALELALKLRAAAHDDTEFMNSALAYLRDGGFEYTLTPQRLGRDAVDDLLFVTHQGFCAHYASAFVTLMRAGGVPARVITGYLGGEWNRVGGYLTVRQSDAHAWAEVWLGGRGWVRADPTAVIAPGRVSRGAYEFNGREAGSGARLLHAPWLMNTLQAWDALNAWWQDDVVGFNFARQLDLARWLGFADRDWQALAAALAIGLTAWMVWMAWTLRHVLRAARPDTIARAWRRVDARLARAGRARASHEDVLAHARRLAREHPALGATLLPLATQYAQLRYGTPGEPAQLRDFLHRARAFRVPLGLAHPPQQRRAGGEQQHQ